MTARVFDALQYCGIQSRRHGPKDINQTVASGIEAAANPGLKPEKNPAAVALGRLGGLKGGKARAEALSPERRSKIARDAINARWKKHRAAQGKKKRTTR